MKLIKISEDEIYDMDTTTAYKLKSNNRYQKDGTPVESIKLIITTSGGSKDIYYYLPASLNLWGYLDENANYQTFRTEEAGNDETPT